jgi:regulator of replication initiation timing
MRDTLSGHQLIPSNELGPVARRITFSAAATPGVPEFVVRRPPAQPARALTVRPGGPQALASARVPPAVGNSPRAGVAVPARASPEPIDVVLRVRPLTAAELKDGPSAVTVDPKQPGVVTIVPRNPALHNATIRANSQALFRFARVFDVDVSQQQLFTETACPLIHALFRGTNGLVFAYGTSNAGKTYTIQGTPENPGILPRSLDVIFNSIIAAKCRNKVATEVNEVVTAITGNCGDECAALPEYAREETIIPIDQDAEYSVLVSYLEIYNEQCFDLFKKPRPIPASPSGHPTPSTDLDVDQEAVIDVDQNPERCPESLFPASRQCSKPPKFKRPVLKLKEDRNANEVFVDGLTHVEVFGVSDVKTLLEFGQKNRSVAQTGVNERSSRSHTIFNIKLEKRTRTKRTNGSGSNIIRSTSSKLSIVDLAGNERTSRTNTTGERLKESSLINKSLMNLGHCLEAMRQNQRLMAAQASSSQDENAPANRIKITQKHPKALMPRKVVTVPFRQSRLTRLFQQSLETGSAVMIVNVSPASRDADETIHALRRAAVAREVTIAASKNPELNKTDISLEQELQSKLKLAQKLHQTKAEEDAKTIKDLNQQIAILRDSLEELRLEFANERGELESEQDELWRENERLRDKLAQAESCFAVRENELRDEILQATEDILAQKDERYRVELERMWHDGQHVAQARADIVSNTARKKIRGMEEKHRREIGNSIARRVSIAVRPALLNSDSENDDADIDNSPCERDYSNRCVAKTLRLDDLEVDEEEYSDEGEVDDAL